MCSAFFTFGRNSSMYFPVKDIIAKAVGTRREALISDIGNIVEQFDGSDMEKIGFPVNYLAILKKESNCD
jgi:phage regulator Rha-like protein